MVNDVNWEPLQEVVTFKVRGNRDLSSWGLIIQEDVQTDGNVNIDLIKKEEDTVENGLFFSNRNNLYDNQIEVVAKRVLYIAVKGVMDNLYDFVRVVLDDKTEEGTVFGMIIYFYIYMNLPNGWI